MKIASDFGSKQLEWNENRMEWNENSWNGMQTEWNGMQTVRMEWNVSGSFLQPVDFSNQFKMNVIFLRK